MSKCDDCGEELRPGAWPWCVSSRNPKGHSTEKNYGWAFKQGQNQSRRDDFFRERGTEPWKGVGDVTK